MNFPSDPRFVDMTGRTYGRFVVIGYDGRLNLSHRWNCKCECGTVKSVMGASLVKGTTKSCGCLARELASLRQTTHGETRQLMKPTEYACYSSAKHRCSSPAFLDYGGRGIEFRFKSYVEFISHIGRKPSPRHSIERIDNSGHYELGNVKWATRYEQSRNKRNNHRIEINGVTRLISEWAGCLGLVKSAIHQRLAYGWCETCAVTLKRGEICSHKKEAKNG